MGHTTVTGDAVGLKTIINIQYSTAPSSTIHFVGLWGFHSTKPSPSSLKASAFHYHACDKLTSLQLPVHDYH